jgi:High-temperature-induced dauer-formation protein
MGASESKLVFKQGIFRLSEDQAIPAGDPYWTGVGGIPSLTRLIADRCAVLGTSRVSRRCL